MDPVRRGLGLIVISALSFGGVAVLTKLLLSSGMTVLALQSWRWGIAALALGGALAVRRIPWPTGRAAAAGFALGLLGQFSASGLYTASLQYVPAALGSFLLYLSPIFVTLLSAVLLRERLGRRGVVALVLAVAGLALLALAPGVAADPLGVTLALGSAVAYAGTVVVGRKLVGAADPLRVALPLMAGAACAFTLATFATGSATWPGSGLGWAELVTLAVVCTALSISTLYLALPLIGAPRAALVSMLEPVSTIFVASAVLGELFAPVQAAGAAVILVAVALLATEKSIPTAPQAGTPEGTEA